MAFSLDPFWDSTQRPVQKPSDAPIDWRPSVYAAITHPDHPGCVLMVRANDGGGTWQLPGGGVEIHEGLLQGLHREIQEETGYDTVSISTEGVFVDEWAFHSSLDGQFFHSIILIFHATVSEGAIQQSGTADLRDPDEIQEIRWIPLAELKPSSIHMIHRAYVEKFKM